MAGKKGKGKTEGGGKNNAEAARLALLRAREAEAERFLRNENERRRRDETEERIAFLRDEQVRALRAKDNQLTEVTLQLKRATAEKSEDHAACAHQIQQLSSLRDVLVNEGTLAKAEMDELQQLVQRERAATAMQLGQLRDTVEAERRAHGGDRQRLRAQACEALAEAEVLRQRLQRVSEEKEFQVRSSALLVREMEHDLEKAVAMSTAMRAALEERDADGRKNVTLLQLLNAQLEADSRHHETEVAAAQEQIRCATEEVDRVARACSAAHAELEKVKRESLAAKESAATELHELKLLMEQARFDSEYLHHELDTLNTEHREAAAEAERAAQLVRAELQQTQVELETAAKENAEVKALLLRKEREHFDTVTFLNAQVTNGRTTIAQLRDDLQQQRSRHENDVRRRDAANQQAAQELEKQTVAEKDRNEARHAYDLALLAEIEALRVSTTELREQLASREAAEEELRTSKDDEIARLRGILDAHFIPNRQEVEVARESARVDEVFLLKEELRTVKEKSLQRETARQEVEGLLRSRIADQMDIITALQLDLKRAQLGGDESARSLEKEVGRLRKTLEVHNITGG